MTDFKAGDVVLLRSGSVPMTVTKVWQDNEATIECSWFDGAILRDATLPAECIAVVQAGPA